MHQNKRTSKITNFFNSTQKKKIKTESNDVVDDGEQQSQSDSQGLISTEIKKVLYYKINKQDCRYIRYTYLMSQ